MTSSIRDDAPEAGLDALVARMATGDQQALAELYDATSSLVFGTCMRILGERAAAEEASLEAFLQAWRQAGAHDASRGSVEAWLVVIARSRALDARRRQRREGARAEAPAAVQEPGPDELAGRAAEARRVRAALAGLPREQSQALIAAYYDGMSHSEIAAALKQPLGTIKTRIRAGLARLRRDLGHDIMSTAT